MDYDLRSATYAAELILRVYIDDVKNLVSTEVQSQLQAYKREKNRAIRSIASTRRHALKQWSESTEPLALHQKTVEDLILCINHTSDSHNSDYKRVNTNHTSYAFIKLLIDHCNQKRPRIRPPFIPNGRLAMYLKVAYPMIEKAGKSSSYTLTDGSNGSDPLFSFIMRAFLTAFTKLNIQHIPWVPGPSASTNTNKVEYNFWTTIEQYRSHIQEMPDPVDNILPTTHASRLSQQTILQAPSGEWSCAPGYLTDLATYLHKTCAPKELSLNHTSFSGADIDLTRETYAWVFARYSGNNPLHQLAMIAGIAAGGLAPNVRFDENETRMQSLSTLQSPNFLKRLTWTDREKSKTRRGVTETNPFITMTTVFIIAMMDSNSPLRQNWENKSRSKEKTAWTHKHSRLTGTF
jgi:hypothetical protein